MGRRTGVEKGLKAGQDARPFLFRELLEVALPEGLLIPPELTQVGPAIEAAVVTVVKYESYGVMADGLDLADLHRLLTDDQCFLSRAMPLHLGRGRVHTQEFEGQGVTLRIIEYKLEQPRLTAQADLAGRCDMTFGVHGAVQCASYRPYSLCPR